MEITKSKFKEYIREFTIKNCDDVDCIIDRSTDIIANLMIGNTVTIMEIRSYVIGQETKSMELKIKD